MNNSPKSSSSKNEQKDQPRDFELIELLFRDKVSIRPDASSDPRSTAQLENFVTRFQSSIDQIPSYLHSVEKPGFFTHYWFGAFSTVLDTKLNSEKLGIKKLHFRFDDARTLKVVAETEQKTHVFIFNEDISKKDFSFTKGEWRGILGRDPTPSEVRKLKIDLINIKKDNQGIHVQRESKKIYKDSTVNKNPFQEIQPQLRQKNKAGKHIYLEDYVHEFSNPIAQEVNDKFSEFLKHTTKVHNAYPGIPYGSEEHSIGRNKETKTFREANHHGFLTGALMNYKYRYNAKIYPEQFSGRGSSDIVALFRGPDRMPNAVRMIIEVKSGADVSPTEGLVQTDKYTRGSTRVLTNSDQAVSVGLNFDFVPKKGVSETNVASKIVSIPKRDEILMESILTDINSWNKKELSEDALRRKIKDFFSHEYGSFPGTKESKQHQYFSRYVLGQSILMNTLGRRDSVKKYVFSYSENPLEDTVTRDAKSSGPSVTLENNRVTTLLFIRENNPNDKTAFIVHINENEDRKKKFSDKTIPIASIKGIGGVKEVVEISLSLTQNKDGAFFDIDRISNKIDNKKEIFKGNFIEIPSSDTLKTSFDHAIRSQREIGLSSTLSSDIPADSYKKLFSEALVKIMYPIKGYINNEAQLQGFLNGLASSYSDLKLKESLKLSNPNERIIVIPEFQTGGGGRVDMLVQAIGPSAQGTKEYVPVLLEFKINKDQEKGLSHTDANKIVERLTKKQIDQYSKGAAVKVMTDSDKVAAMGIVFNVNAKDPGTLIFTSKTFTTAEVVHSSIIDHNRKVNLRGCLRNRSKRSTGHTGCLISWEDIDKFNAEKEHTRDYDKIKIDSDKFLEHLGSVENMQKKSELIQLLDEAINSPDGKERVVGKSQHQIDMILSHHSATEYLNNVEKVSSYHNDHVNVKGCLVNRSKRSIKRRSNGCSISWEDIEMFNVGEKNRRNYDDIKIDLEKFSKYLSNEKNINKRDQAIGLLAEIISSPDYESRIKGEYDYRVSRLVNGYEAARHARRLENIYNFGSFGVLYGVIGKDILGNVIELDYEGVATGLGFFGLGITGDIFAQKAYNKGLGLVEKKIGFGNFASAQTFTTRSQKVSKLIPKNKLMYSLALRSAAPFLARGTSAFAIYDLVNHVKQLKSGNEDALVPVIGDSAVLVIDVTGISLELGGVAGSKTLGSAASRFVPAGSVVQLVIFGGTQTYFAVKTVGKIDDLIDLTPWEKFKAGWRAFLTMEPEPYIKDYVDEKILNNQSVKERFERLKHNTHIQGYVFPSYEKVIDSEGKSKIQIALNNFVSLDKKIPNIQWTRTIPDSLEGGNLFCLPEGDWQAVPDSEAYKCTNAIGLTRLENKETNITIFDLGTGLDNVNGFPDQANIFIVNDGEKRFYGGNQDDTFIFEGNDIKGIFNGLTGNNTADLSEFGLKRAGVLHLISQAPSRYSLEIENRPNSNDCILENINKIIGRKNKPDNIEVTCTTNYIRSQGGENDNSGIDQIGIKDEKCFYKTQLTLDSNTKVFNSGLGNFTYIIQPGTGLTIIDVIGKNSSNNFIFNYSLSNIHKVKIENNQTTAEFSFNFNNDLIYKLFPWLPYYSSSTTVINIPLENNSTTYQLNDGTQIEKIENILYASQSVNKSTDDIIKDYLPIAERSGMFIVAQSLVSNETVSIGAQKQNIFSNEALYISNVIRNNPLYKSHLVGGNSENIYVIISGYEVLQNIAEFKIPETTIHECNDSNLTDTLDLRNLHKQVIKDLGIDLKVKLKEDGENILIQLFISSDQEKKEQDVTSILLKDGIKNNWYKRLHVILENAPMVIEYNNNIFKLTSIPLRFPENIRDIIIRPQDIDQKTRIEIAKEAGKYSFIRNKENLIITNIDPSSDKKNWYSISLNDFYEEDLMKEISIKFNDKEIFLKKEIDQINDAEEWNQFRERINDHMSSIIDEITQVNNQTRIDSGSNIPELTTPSLTRRRRDTVEYNKDHLQLEKIRKEQIADSSHTTFSEQRNNVLNSDSIKRIPSIGTDQYGADTGNYSLVNIDLNGGLTWLNVLARWFTGYKEKPIKGASSNLEMDIKAKEIAYRSRSFELVDLFVKNIKKNLAASGLSGPRFDPDDKVVDQVREKVYTKLLKGETDTISDIQELVKKTIDKIESNSTKKQAKAFLNKITADLPSISNALLKKSELQTGMPNTRLKPDLGLLNQSISSMPSVDHLHEPALLTQQKHNATYSIASNETQDVARYRRSAGM